MCSCVQPVIGACDLTLEDIYTADLGYILARDAWGQGYATEIAYTLLHAGFAQLDLQRVFAICDIHHLASVRVLEKAGLRRETTLYDYREAKGRSWDVYRLPTTNGCGGGGYHKLWHPYRDQMQGP